MRESLTSSHLCTPYTQGFGRFQKWRIQGNRLSAAQHRRDPLESLGTLSHRENDRASSQTIVSSLLACIDQLIMAQGVRAITTRTEWVSQIENRPVRPFQGDNHC